MSYVIGIQNSYTNSSLLSIVKINKNKKVTSDRNTLSTCPPKIKMTQPKCRNHYCSNNNHALLWQQKHAQVRVSMVRQAHMNQGIQRYISYINMQYICLIYYLDNLKLDILPLAICQYKRLAIKRKNRVLS